jgi:monoamine oxidase
MTRQEFIRICGLFGIALPFQGVLSSCIKDEDLATPFSGNVLIIGAGAGGLSAGYFLNQQGTRFRILEASAAYGGRMRINSDFSDFPIPLGAEWIETKTSVLQEMVNNPSVQVRVQTFPDHSDSKFLNYSWFNFYEDYIIPSIADKISYNTIVQTIDYSGDQIIVRTDKGEMIADKVILSVPLQVLKDGDVQFSPPLPEGKRNAIRDTVVWEGFKAFFEFRTNFYGNEEYIFPIQPASRGQKIYYNASKGQTTNKHILGLFTVGSPAQDYISRSGDDLKNFILDELDSIYAKQATPNYIQHLTQNWNSEPFIKGGYVSDYEDWRKVRELGIPVANKIYFAGGEFTDGEDWVSVHTAAEAAKRVVGEMNR